MELGILELRNLSKRFDGIQALNDFSCTLGVGETLGIIGPNGAGKTTLFNVVSGFLTPDSGQVRFKGREIGGLPPHKIVVLGIGRTFQNLRLVRQLSVLDNVLLAYMQQPGERLSNVFFQSKKCVFHESANRKEATELLSRIDLLDKRNEPAENLSYGQQKLLSLACCIATQTQVLMLDEPVAGIAPQMIQKMLEIIRELSSSGKSLILIEHNIDVVLQLCTHVIFMDEGAKVCEGVPEEVRNDPRVIEAYLN